MSSNDNSPVKGGSKRVKSEPSSDDEFDSKTFVLNSAGPSPRKRGRPASTSGSKRAGGQAVASLPPPFLPDPTITRPSDGRVVCTILERLIMSAGPELRNEVAAEFGIEARLLHMAWANTIRKKAIVALRKEFVGESPS